MPRSSPTIGTSAQIIHARPVPSGTLILVNTASAQLRRRDRVRVVASGGVALLGVVGIVSAISPPLRNRLQLLLELVPFHIARIAATSLVLVSFALLLMARGLRRGQRLAWGGTLILLVVSAFLNVTKGLDLEEAVLAGAAAAGLATQRRSFPVLPTRSAVRSAVVLGVGGMLGSVLVGTVLTMVLGRRHHPRVGESVRAMASRLGGGNALPLPGVGGFVTPMLVATGIGLIGTALWVLLSPRASRHLTGAAHVVERERARALIARHGGGTLDYFALRDDKDWFFTEQSVVAYSVRRGVCLVSPDPIGPIDERAGVWDDFLRYAEGHGWSIAVVGAAEAWLPLYEASGLRTVYLGDEAIVDCPEFRLEGHVRKSLRGGHGRVRRAGFTAEFSDIAGLDEATRSALGRIATVSRRGEVERGFSMTLSRLFEPADRELMLTVVRDREGVPQAFIQWAPAPGIQGWSLDVMRSNRDEQLPNGLTDFAIIETIRHVAETGGRGLSLNFAVLRGVVAGESQSAVARASRAAIHRISGRSQAESLWRFNAKYDPEWVPRYMMLDSVEFVAAQGLAVANAEGITEIPVIGRFLGRS
jgi:lysyl-tRNA synthetase class 2